MIVIFLLLNASVLVNHYRKGEEHVRLGLRLLVAGYRLVLRLLLLAQLFCSCNKGALNICVPEHSLTYNIKMLLFRGDEVYLGEEGFGCSIVGFKYYSVETQNKALSLLFLIAELKVLFDAQLGHLLIYLLLLGWVAFEDQLHSYPRPFLILVILYCRAHLHRILMVDGGVELVLGD